MTHHAEHPNDNAPAETTKRRGAWRREARDPIPVAFTLTVPRWVPWSAFFVALAAFVSCFTLDLPLTVELHDMADWLKQATEYATELGHAKWHLYGLPAAAGALWLFGRRAGAMIALHLWLSVAAAGLLANLLKVICGRYRPGLYFDQGLWGFTGFSVGYDLNSFPSGHAAVAGALATGLALAFPRGWPAFALAGLAVGFTRVMTGSHWLSDVIVGLYLGAITAHALRAVLRDRNLYPT